MMEDLTSEEVFEKATEFLVGLDPHVHEIISPTDFADILLCMASRVVVEYYPPEKHGRLLEEHLKPRLEHWIQQVTKQNFQQ
jgi:hypothetical protein